MPEPIRLCLFCRHCYFAPGYEYSDVTWEGPSINCLKGANAWCDNTREDFAKWAMLAEVCDEYEVAR